MRFSTVAAISAVACWFQTPLIVAGDEAHSPEVEDDDDTDWDSFETSYADEDEESGETGTPSSEPDSSLVEAADADLSQDERKVRMGVCLSVGRQKFQRAKDMFEPILEQIQEQHKVDESQAIETILISLIKNCYINFNQETDLKDLIASADSEEKFDAISDRLIAPPVGELPGKQSTFASRHWDLIKEIIQKEQEERTTGKKKTTEDEIPNFNQKEAPQIKVNLVGSDMTGFQKFIYFVSVFGAIFGGGYLLVKKLIQREVEKDKKKINKKKQ